MKLYPKRLNNASDLRAEKLLLQYKLEHLDADGMLSLKPGLKKTVASDKKNPGNMLGEILGTGSIVDIALKLLPLLTGKGSNRVVEQKVQKKGPNILVKGLVEIGGGYLKWKAIELSYKGLKKLLSRPKKNA